MPGELEDEYAAIMMTLTFFASPSLADDYVGESHSDLAKLARTIKRLLADAVREYAHLGASIQQVLAESDAAPDEALRSTKVGRNEPCSCGSGEKWKKCCGAVRH